MEHKQESQLPRQRYNPNVFVAIKITDEKIVSRVTELQEMISKGTGSYEVIGPRAFSAPHKLHFTVFTTYLNGSDDISRAQQAFKECCRQIERDLQDKRLFLTVQGMGYFGNNVLFAELENKEDQITRLNRISNIFKEKFGAMGFHIDTRPFKAHLSITSLFRINENARKDVPLYPSGMWPKLENFHFGTDEVRGLQLLSIRETDRETGNYRCYAKYDFDLPATE